MRARPDPANRTGGKSARTPLDATRARRRLERGHPYWWPLRVADAYAGWGDGRRDGRAAGAAGAGPPQPVVRLAIVAEGSESGPPVALTPHLRRNTHSYAERDRREYLTLQAGIAEELAELRQLRSRVSSLTGQVAIATARRAAAPAEPSAEELCRRGPAEGYDSAAVVAARRRREHQSHLGALQQPLQAVEGQYREATERIGELAGLLATAYEIAATRSERLRHCHERRAATYLRWHRRGWHRRARALDCPLHAAAATIAAPGWIGRPCPWLGEPGVFEPAAHTAADGSRP